MSNESDKASPHLLWEPESDEQQGLAFMGDPLVEVTTQKLAANARLYEVATQRVGASLVEMERKKQQAIMQNPDLQPYLDQYFAAARMTLMQNTLAVLDGATRPHQEARQTDQRRWRTMGKLIPHYHTPQAIKARILKKGVNRHGATPR